MENRFKQSLLDPNVLSVTLEVVPGRGAREKSQETAIALAEQAAVSLVKRHHDTVAGQLA